MKKRKFNLISKVMFIMSLFALVTLVSCEDEPEPVDNPVASFQFAIDATNYLQVAFTNYSQNATTYSWAFGDGETSTEENPVHVYAEAGMYTVTLTAANDEGTTANYSLEIEITDPNSALTLLAGTESKTWKLFREGTSMSLGPDASNPAGWWEGLTNQGARPCLYYQTFTFHANGDYVFDDNGMFWGEYGVFPEEVCFEATVENMVNANGDDVSAWLSGTHSFEYDPSTGTLTLNGLGAWIGIPKLGPAGETTVPIASTSCNISIEEMTGYDVMTIVFDYGDGGYWLIKYASYSDPSLEPEVVEVQPPYGEDLPDLTPTEMWNTFETSTSFMVLDTAGVYPGNGVAANGGMSFFMGVADPAGGAVNVGQYDRAGTYQELQFQMENDIQFDNFTTVSLDVYIPSSNDYSTTLTKGVSIIIGEASQTEQWWTGHTQYDATVETMDEWVTLTFNLSEPTSGGMYNPKDRTDLDFFAISIGGGGHDATGTFYVRNFVFN